MITTSRVLPILHCNDKGDLNSTQQEFQLDSDSGNEKTVDQRRKRKPCGEKGPLPPKKQKTEDIFKSKWWKFYDPIYEVDEEGNKVRKSKCKFCEKILSAGGIHGRRVLNPYRTSLSSQHVDALFCAQDWIRRKIMKINMDEIEDLSNDDEVVKEMKEAWSRSNHALVIFIFIFAFPSSLPLRSFRIIIALPTYLP
ncbi:zinc finger BED domain-containing protein RICESLEEPER 2 [Tanacetum coccineum]